MASHAELISNALSRIELICSDKTYSASVMGSNADDELTRQAQDKVSAGDIAKHALSIEADNDFLRKMIYGMPREAIQEAIDKLTNLLGDRQIATRYSPYAEVAEYARGRDLRAGYQRAVGLRFGDLAMQVHQDPLYNYATNFARGRTLMFGHDRMNLYLIIKDSFWQLPQGHIVEFGSFRGGNALFMAAVCRELRPEVIVYAFDTFEGIPSTDGEHDAHQDGDFSNSEYHKLLDIIESENLGDNLKLVRGEFDVTAPIELPKIGHIRLNHIDPDAYSAVKYAYDASIPYTVQGGYWVFDDPLVAGTIGALEAVEEVVIRRDGRHAEQAYPHLVYRNF